MITYIFNKEFYMKQKIFTLLVIMVTMLVPLYAQSEGDFEVRQNADNTLTITGYNGTERNVVIPDTLYGLRVTSIASGAFHRKGLVSVVIPDSVITIEDGGNPRGTFGGQIGAFSQNKELTRVALGNGLRTIGRYAFHDTGLTEINIPDSVTTIGIHSFTNGGDGWVLTSRDGGLAKVTFGTGLQVIGFGAFRNNSILELNLPSSLREIGNLAFCGNRIQKITFGTGLQIIGEAAFYNNLITELNLPSSLREIKGAAFANNQISSLTIPNGVTSISNFWRYDGGRWIGAFSNNPLTTVVIPASLAREGISTSFWNDSRSRDSQQFGRASSSTITRIIIPAGMNENTLVQNFEEAFVNFWRNQNRAGGTYIKRGPIWSRE
jgi:hypothetical protein